MKLSEVFEQLSQGELSQVKIGEMVDGQLDPANYRAMGNHVWLGLTDLYRRFNLKKGKVTVQLFTDVLTYTLQKQYAVQNTDSNAPYRWILDEAGTPFSEDVQKILTITGDNDFEFALNDWADRYSMITPTMNSIRVPLDVVNQTTDLADCYKITKMVVEYQASHPNFMPRVGIFYPEQVNIELPMSHLQALLYFVASRVHNPIGMGQEFNAGNNWAQRYELECQRLENDGAEIDTTGTNTHAVRNGWC